MARKIPLFFLISLSAFVLARSLEAQNNPSPVTSPSYSVSPTSSSSGTSSPMQGPAPAPAPSNSPMPMPTAPGMDCLDALGGERETTSTEAGAGDESDVITQVYVYVIGDIIKRETVIKTLYLANTPSIENYLPGPPTGSGAERTDKVFVRCKSEEQAKITLKIETAPLRSSTGNCQFDIVQPEKVLVDTLFTGDYIHYFVIPIGSDGDPIDRISPSSLVSQEQFQGDLLAQGPERPRIWKTSVLRGYSGSSRHLTSFEKSFLTDNSGALKKKTGYSNYHPEVSDYGCFLRDDFQNQSYRVSNCNAPDALGQAVLSNDSWWLQNFSAIHGAIEGNRFIFNGLDRCYDGGTSTGLLVTMYAVNNPLPFDF